MRIEIKDKKQFIDMFNRLYKNIRINDINAVRLNPALTIGFIKYQVVFWLNQDFVPFELY